MESFFQYAKDFEDRMGNWVLSGATVKRRIASCLEALQTGEPLRSNPENVEFFNSLQVSTAERFVFSSNDNFSIVKEMIRANPELRHGRRILEATGKF